MLPPANSKPRAIRGFDANATENVPVKDVKSVFVFAFAHRRPGIGAFRLSCAENRPETHAVSSVARGASFAI